MAKEREAADGVRINKYMSEAGYCSRREADRLVVAGRVTVDGVKAEVGTRILPGMRVCVDGVCIEKEEEEILIAFHKPEGVVCTSGKYEGNIIDYINYPKRIYPVGRLDKDSTGLILLTNNGELMNQILHAGNLHEKEYIVTVNKDVTNEFLEGMAGGVPILDTVTRKCEVKRLQRRKFKIVLTQGLNRQIRRMCEYFGYRVVALKRVRFMNITVEGLKEGEYRDVTKQEKEEMMQLIAAHNANRKNGQQEG
jgi:23S rRNA pseudouridine2604 synthase